jgi:hypothetical protein
MRQATEADDILAVQDFAERRFAIGRQFWDGWCDARNHDWK